MNEQQKKLATRILAELQSKHMTCEELALALEEKTYTVGSVLGHLKFYEEISHYCDPKTTVYIYHIKHPLLRQPIVELDLDEHGKIKLPIVMREIEDPLGQVTVPQQ